MLHNFGEKGSIFLRVGARDKVFPAYSFGFPALALMRASGSFEKGVVKISGVFVIVYMRPVSIPS